MGNRSTKAFVIGLAIVIAIVLAIPVGGMMGLVGKTEAARQETVLKIGFMEPIDSLNPFLGWTEASYIFYGLVYDNLQSIGNDMKPAPNLATSWYVVPDALPYGSVWQYNLTANAVWTDGENVTADDVVFTINLQAQNYDMFWSYEPYIFYIEQAEKIDNHTVRVHFFDRVTGDPAPGSYANLLSFPILPKHKLESMTPVDIAWSWDGLFDDEDPPLVGTGPFMATSNIRDEWMAGDQITLVRNPNYHWGPDKNISVHFDKILLKFFDDATAMRIALENGAIDVAKFPPQVYAEIKDAIDSGMLDDVKAFDGPSPTGYFEYVCYCMNNAGPNPSRLDPTIRHAMAMATNKTYIAENFYFGYADEATTLVAPVFSEWHYEPIADDKFPFNVTMATELLDKAGYVDIDGNGIRECTAASWAVVTGLVPEGKPLSYELLVRVEHPEEKEIAFFLKEAYNAVGINLNIVIMDTSTLMTIVYSYQYDLYIGWWSADPDPNFVLFPQTKKAWSGWSDNKYYNESYEANYNSSVSEMNPALRKTYVDNCQLIHYLDAAYINMAYLYQTYAWRTDTFVGWGDWARDPGRSIDAYWSGNPLWFDLIPIAGNSPPVDLFIEPSPDPGSVGVMANFNVSATDIDGDPLTLTMEFGDGTVDVIHTTGGSPDPQGATFYHIYFDSGTYDVTLWADDGNGTPLHNASRSISYEVLGPVRTVDYYWYDMFNVPFGEWWDVRWDVYGNWEPLTDAYPFIWRMYYAPPGNSFTFTNMRLNITGRNMPDLNMLARPEFLPFMGAERGGNATIDWYMQYATSADLSRYPIPPGNDDGFLVILNGTVALDEQAAKAVINLTDAGYDDFPSWWAANGATVEADYVNWSFNEGNFRLDIYNMYGTYFLPIYWSLNAEKIGEEIVLTYDSVSWGMECLMTRWLREAFMPTEWIFEGMDLHARIGPDMADVDIDSAVDGPVYAYETVPVDGNLTGEPCWVWTGCLQDYVPSSFQHPHSDYDPYQDKVYLHRSPGGLYDVDGPYELTPGSFNLSEDESMVFEWPAGLQLFLGHGGPGETVNETAAMTVQYSEPMDSDLPSSVTTDLGSRTISFEGPIDFWSWSKNQMVHEWLASEWDRVGLLPYGMPYIEFGKGVGAPPVANFTVTPTEGNVSTMFVFDASSSSDSEDPVSLLEVRWDWEDDDVWDTDWSAEKVASHQYGSMGIYTARLAVRDTDSNEDETTRTVSVLNTPPVAFFTVDPVSGDKTTTFTFDASLSSDLEDPATSLQVRWDFDGNDVWDTIWMTTKTSQYQYASVGTYTAMLEVRDTLALVSSTTRVVDVLDVDAPVTTIQVSGTAGSNGWYVSSVTVTMTAEDEDTGVASTHYRIDSGVWQDYSSPFAVSTDGDHLLEYYSVDNADNSEATKTSHVKVDTAAPQTSITVAGTLGSNGWYTSTLTVTLSGADSASGLESTYYSIDSGALLTYSNAFAITAEGEHVVAFHSVDVAGNEESAQVQYLKIDTGVPVTNALVVGTQSASGWYTSAVSATLSVSSDLSGINHTFYRLGAGDWLTYSGTIVIQLNGTFSLQIRSEDVAGNVETAKTIPISIDRAPPSLSYIGPKSFDSSSVTLSWSQSDVQSGIDHVETSLDGAAYVSIGTASTVSLTDLADGTHTLAIRVVDIAGNVAETTITFDVDTGGPLSIAAYAAIAAIVIVVLVVAAFLLLRKRKKGPGEEATPPETTA